jgi:hypothetical protein
MSAQHDPADGVSEPGDAARDEIRDEMVLTLRKPITVGKGAAAIEYTEVQLTEPTVGQLKQASRTGNAIEQLAILISLNGKLPMAVVDQMLQRDLDRAGDFFGRFGNESPPTPAMSSLS